MTNSIDMEPSSLTAAGSDEQNHIYHFGAWELNVHTNQLAKEGKSAELEHRLTHLLVYFLQHRNQILTKDNILKVIWQKKVVTDDSLAVAISHLRKVLEDNPRSPTYIKTIPGVGYQFILPLSEQPTNSSYAKKSNPQSRFAALRSWFLLVIIFIFAIGYLFNVGIKHYKNENIASSLPDQANNTYDQAIKLLTHSNEKDLRLAITLFHKVIQEDPQNGGAFLGLAEAKINLLDENMFADNYMELIALLNKALELNPNLARAHVWMAIVLFKHDYDYSEAERHYKLSLSLNPNDDFAHSSYARFLFIQKRFTEAREHIVISQNLNPIRFVQTNLVWLYLIQGNSDLAERELQRIASTEETDIFFKITAQNVYYSAGNEKKVYENMQWFFHNAKFSKEKIATLDKIFSQGGLSAVNKWLLDNKEVAELGQYTPPLSWARYAVAAGQKDLALDYLEQAFKKKQAHTECAAADPRFAPLFDEARFMKLIGNVNSKKNN